VFATVFQLNSGGQFYLWRKPQYPQKTVLNAKRLCSHCDRDRMVVGFITTLCNQCLSPLRCEFEPCSGEVYSIQDYVIKFVSDLRQVNGFHRVLWFPPDDEMMMTSFFLPDQNVDLDFCKC
jgi:hypothetical protein